MNFEISSVTRPLHHLDEFRELLVKIPLASEAKYSDRFKFKLRQLLFYFDRLLKPEIRMKLHLLQSNYKEISNERTNDFYYLFQQYFALLSFYGNRIFIPNLLWNLIEESCSNLLIIGSIFYQIIQK